MVKNTTKLALTKKSRYPHGPHNQTAAFFFYFLRRIKQHLISLVSSSLFIFNLFFIEHGKNVLTFHDLDFLFLSHPDLFEY